MFRSNPFQAAVFATGGCGRADVHPGWRAMSGRHEHGHPRHGGRGEGPFDPRGPWGGWGFGPGGGFGRGRGRRARRGDVRTAALLLLAEEPRNGYQIIQELEERSDGAWRPSAGSVYPALQLLEDEGLIRSEQVDGRKLLHLTDAGRKLVEERRGDQPTPWEEMAGDVSDDARAIMQVMKEAIIAVTQVMQTGTDAQRAETKQKLVDLRRDLYRMLADGDDQDAGKDA